MELKVHYPHLDQLKGLAIIFMVMGHGIAWSYPDFSFLFKELELLPIELFNASILWKIIYSFHMPLLFFVSGFLFYKSNKIWNATRIKEVIEKRTKRLLIPYITTGCFVCFLKGYFGYWFFLVLFVLNIIVAIDLFIIDKLELRISKEILVYVFTLLFLFVTSKLYADYLPRMFSNLGGLPIYYVSFMFGYLSNKYRQIEKLLLSDYVSLVGLVCYVILMVLVNYYGLFNTLSIIIPIFATIFLYHMFSKYNSKILGGVSSYSMEIYILHIFFLAPIKEVGEYIVNVSSFPISITIQLTYSLAITSIAILFSIITAKVIKTNHILSKLLFGS